MNTICRSQFAVMLHSVPHLGPKGLSRLLSEIPCGRPDELIDLADVRSWQLSADTLKREYGVHSEAAHALVDRKDELLSAGKAIHEAACKLGIRVLTVRDPDYPPSVLEYDPDPPPIIYAHGNMGLLRDRKFAVVSSSGVSGEGLDTIRECAGLLADEGLAAVTSHNTQAYQVVGLAAKSRNAPVALVLDRGILTTFPQGLGWEPVAQARIWNLRFDPVRDVVISRFRLYDHWIGANARERDRMVFSLSNVVVAVEVRPGGVMESECTKAHKRGREVYVMERDGSTPEGNRTLIDQGCTPITPSSARAVLTTLDIFDRPTETGFGELP